MSPTGSSLQEDGTWKAQQSSEPSTSTEPSKLNKRMIGIATGAGVVLLVLGGAVSAINHGASATSTNEVATSSCEIDTLPLNMGERGTYATFKLENKTDQFLSATIKVEMSQNGRVVDSYTGVWDRKPHESGKVMMDNLVLNPVSWSNNAAAPTCTLSVVKTSY